MVNSSETIWLCKLSQWFNQSHYTTEINSREFMLCSGQPYCDRIKGITATLLGNGRNTVSRVLFRRRELTEFWGKLGEFWGKLGEFGLHTNKGWEELTDWNSVSPKKLTEFGVCVLPETVFGPFITYERRRTFIFLNSDLFWGVWGHLAIQWGNS